MFTFARGMVLNRPFRERGYLCGRSRSFAGLDVYCWEIPRSALVHLRASVFWRG